MLSISLRSDGYDVITALSGEEGVGKYETESPDIVLTDIKMPGMDGIEVLQKVKSIDEDAQVIIITGHGDIENAIEALKYGASDFINKPVRDDILAIALERAKEKLEIKRKLKRYTEHLEIEVRIATSELEKKSNFLAKLIRSSNDGIIATDAAFNTVIFNPGAERIFGYSHEDMIFKIKAIDLYPPDVAKIFDVAAGYKGKRKGELPWEETMITAKDGSPIPVRFSGTLLFSKKKVMGSVAFFQDLREIKRLEAELVQSERLAAIGQTVAGMAHGVKNILHGFKGGSYLVELGLKRNNTEKLESGWDMIKRNIKRTSDLVLDLLSYSKEREPEFEECLPNEIAGDVCETVEETAHEHHVEIVREFDPFLGTVVMDPHTIHCALLNLVSNAIDACLFDEIFDEGENKKWRVCLKTSLEKGAVRFDVIDNGAGMDDEVKKKLFSSFFSTKGHRGTGLGLLVTRKAVEEHNGAIEVESELGEGTTFTIRLPFQNESRLR